MEVLDLLNELIALNYFLYDAVERMMDEQTTGTDHIDTTCYGPGLFSRELSEKSERIKTQLQILNE